jgi:phenylalanyl-tRNA synthetase beta chain
MVSVEINKSELLRLIGKELSDEEIVNTLFNLKCEANIIGDQMTCEITPDRIDMCCVEGIARAMAQYLELPTPKVEILPSDESLVVESVKARPYIRTAIVKGLEIDETCILNLMQLQEKLHATIGRNRKKVAVGIHDISHVRGPFTYKEIKPSEIKFIPLGEKREMNLAEILLEHPKGKEYRECLVGFEKYPILLDAKSNVLSFPPIINGELTRVTTKTKDLLIDVTGTNLKAVENTLNIIISALAMRGGKIYEMKIRNANESVRSPNFEPRAVRIKFEKPSMLLGIQLNPEDIISSLERMGYESTVVGNEIDVFVPPYRSDVFSDVDIIEDIAIGYGYSNIIPELPKLATQGGLSKVESISRDVRAILAGFGAQEILNFVLTTPTDNFDKMNAPRSEFIEIENPVSQEYTILRTWLIPSLVRLLGKNKHRAYPQKIFEVGDCVVRDGKSCTFSKTIRKAAIVITHDSANLTEAKSVVEGFLKALGINYMIASYEHPSFIPSRCGVVIVNGKEVGFFGEIHPAVLETFDIDKPVIAAELCLNDLFGF